MRTVGGAFEVNHAIDASKRCAPTLVGMGIELLLGKDVTTSLSDGLVSDPVHMFQLLQRIPHTRKRPCRINARLVKLCCVAKWWRLLRDNADSINDGFEKLEAVTRNRTVKAASNGETR